MRGCSTLSPQLSGALAWRTMEAPLVSLEEEFEEGPGDDGGTPQRAADPALAELESFSAEMMSFKSMEDLVQEFDEKLTVCFRNYDAATEGLAPVRGRLQAQEEEERLQDEEVWDALTDGFAPRGSPRPWLLPGAEAPDGTDPQLCEKEEEELTERSEQDSGINEEPLLTAEQVIEELEELMQSSPDPEADPEGDEDEDEEEEEEEETEADAEGEGGGGGTEPILLRELRAFSPAFNNNCSHEAGLGRLSTRELAAAAGRAEAASRALSAELVAQLARRDELAFEKEVKTAFIGALLAVQGEQREQREAARRRRRDKGLSLQGGRLERGNHMPRKRFSMEGISSILHSGLRQTFGPATNEKQYLNTVIPYEKKGSPPSVEDLQMLTNILFAMKEGNEKVPTLLTDYILKVQPCASLCTLMHHCMCSYVIVHTRTRAQSYILMDPHASSWILMNPRAHLCIIMHPRAYLCLIMDPHASLCTLKHRRAPTCSPVQPRCTLVHTGAHP
ncbi:fasciculation and elongation protein zeta-1 isoform X3 [Grus americana]|uniref:fasciculation and elongation protein zeta-1 isoform X3 n=1 Tax=Grus americana TaxID=9117 RepID=UPI0024085BC5|nr:fasciculation and elongation protein zeta-1 isoform X3 [Grus americana]